MNASNTKKQVNNQQFVKKIVEKFSRGNVSLQRGRYITKERVQERLQRAKQFKFANL